jgi:hypothetical protein
MLTWLLHLRRLPDAYSQAVSEFDVDVAAVGGTLIAFGLVLGLVLL